MVNKTVKEVQCKESPIGFTVTPTDFHRTGDYCKDVAVIHLDVNGRKYQVIVEDDMRMEPWYVEALLDFICVNEVGDEPELRESAKKYCIRQIFENSGGYTWGEMIDCVEGFIEGYTAAWSDGYNKQNDQLSAK